MSRFRLLYLVAIVTVLTLVACSASQFDDGSGAFPMTEFTHANGLFRGVHPINWQQTFNGEPEPGMFICEFLRAESVLDFKLLNQVAITGMNRSELDDLIETQLFIDSLPEGTSVYKSRFLDWELYAFDAYSPDIPKQMHILMGLAEQSDVFYIVMVVGIVEHYEDFPTYYDTLFEHVMYAFEPLE